LFKIFRASSYFAHFTSVAGVSWFNAATLRSRNKLITKLSVASWVAARVPAGHQLCLGFLKLSLSVHIVLDLSIAWLLF